MQQAAYFLPVEPFVYLPVAASAVQRVYFLRQRAHTGKQRLKSLLLNNYYFHDFSADMHKSINDLWNKLKIESGDEESSTSSIYIICGVVIVLLVVAYVISRIKKKKREEA